MIEKHFVAEFLEKTSKEELYEIITKMVEDSVRVVAHLDDVETEIIVKKNAEEDKNIIKLYEFEYSFHNRYKRTLCHIIMHAEKLIKITYVGGGMYVNSIEEAMKPVELDKAKVE